MKKTIFVACFIAFFLPLTASAYSIKTGDTVYLPKDQTIDGNLYAAGANITIDGRVTGDIICAGQSINIMGQIDGDVICAGQSININGPIGGNLRLVGNGINFGGQVARNAMILGATTITSASSTIGWDLLAVGNLFELRGKIGRDLHGSVAKATIAGPIGKNVSLNFGADNGYTNPLSITETANISGDLKYTSMQQAVIENSSSIKGQMIHNLPKLTVKKDNFFNFSWWWGKLISIFSSLVIGLVLISLWRGPIIKITDLMLNKAGVSLGWGVLALLLTPPIAIILLITIIGIPLSIIMMATWLIVIYISKIFTGILVGRSLLNSLAPKQKDSLILAMIVGVIIVSLIYSLPFIGWFMALLATLWGLGGIMLALKNK